MSCPPDPDACLESLQVNLRPELFFALCEPTRVQLLCRLAMASGPLTVTELSGCCGTHLSGVSRHLAILRDAGVVEASRQGREVRYHLACSALSGALRSVADAIDGCQAACCQRQDPASEKPS